MNTTIVYPEFTICIIRLIWRLWEFSEGEGESESEIKGSKVHCPHAVVECNGSVQPQSAVVEFSSILKGWVVSRMRILGVRHGHVLLYSLY